jgi:hypothetical protein
MTNLTHEQVRNLAEGVRAKILSKEPLVSQSEGKIIIKVFRKGDGFDVKISVTA